MVFSGLSGEYIPFGHRTLEVPTHLKDASYHGAKKLGHGEGYKYSHQYKDHFVEQEYIPEKRTYYEPTDIGYEKKIREYLERIRENPKSQ